MWFIANDRKIPISDLIIVDDLSMYHTAISFSTNARFGVLEGTIQHNSSKMNVVIVNQTPTDKGLFKTDCVTRDIYDKFKSVTAGYNGRITIDGLFRKLGFQYKSNYVSNNSYFSIPQCKVTTLFDKLTLSASFANGGGAHFYMQLDGVVYGYDYKLIKEKSKAISIKGEVYSENTNTDWMEFTASEYELYYWDNNNRYRKENFVIERGWGKMAVPLNDTTGVWKDVVKQELTNKFYNKWFNSHQLLVNLAPSKEKINIGQLVSLYDGKDTFIVRGITMAFDEVSEMPSISAVLISESNFKKLWQLKS